MDEPVEFDPKGFSFDPGQGSEAWQREMTSRYNQWMSFDQTDGCAFDYVTSSTILEWLAQNSSVVDIDQRLTSRYRRFSELVSADRLISQLILFEKVYLNIGVFYRDYMDLGGLEAYEFIEAYPVSYERSFLDSYRLIKPLAMPTILDFFARVIDVPYDQVWVDDRARRQFKNYRNLVSWLYDEFAKDACGLESHEMAIMGKMKSGHEYAILDFMEYIVHGQGSLLSGRLPMFSCVVKPAGRFQKLKCRLASPVRDDVLGLYQVASRRALGFSFCVESFDQVLRLRDDRRVSKIRSLLRKYVWALNESEESIAAEIIDEMTGAKKALQHLAFVEHPAYSFIVKPITYVPVVGNLVNLAADCLDVVNMYLKRKHGWIYFGTD